MYYTVIHNVSSTNFTGYAPLQVYLSEYWRIKGEEMGLDTMKPKFWWVAKYLKLPDLTLPTSKYS